MAAIFAGGTLLLSAVILMISAAVTTAPKYRITGTIIGSPTDLKMLDDCRQMAGADMPAPPGANGKKGWDVEIDRKQGTLTLSVEAEEPTPAATGLDKTVRSMVDYFNAQLASRPAVDPAVAAEDARLRNLIAECDRQLAATSQPAASQPRGVSELLISLQQTLTERQKTAARLREIADQLKEPPPTIEQVALTTMPATLPSQDGQQVLRRLEADTAALRQRQGRLTELLRELLETSLSRLEAGKSAVNESAKGLAGTVPADAEQEVRSQLQTIQEALTAWSTAANTLTETWASIKNDLQSANDEFDAPACQKGLETAAKSYLDDAIKARGKIDAALIAIKEGGDEPTKRIILHRNVTQKIQPVLESMDKAQAAARLVQLNENAQLGALVKMVASLRDRVNGQRGEIQSQLRDQTLQELRAKHEEQLGSLRLQQDQIQQKASELETTMIGGIAEIVGALAGQESQRVSTSRALQLQQQRASLLEQLVKLKETPPPDRPAPLRYQPAHLTAIVTPPGLGFGQALRVGLGPMATSFVAIAGIWFWLRWRKSQGTLDDLARELKMASRHGKERHHR